MVIPINREVIEMLGYECTKECLVMKTINYSDSRGQSHREENKLDV